MSKHVMVPQPDLTCGPIVGIPEEEDTPRQQAWREVDRIAAMLGKLSAEERAMLAAVANGKMPPWIYADWLEERDKPEAYALRLKAELDELRVKLSRLMVENRELKEELDWRNDNESEPV